MAVNKSNPNAAMDPRRRAYLEAANPGGFPVVLGNNDSPDDPDWSSSATSDTPEDSGMLSKLLQLFAQNKPAQPGQATPTPTPTPAPTQSPAVHPSPTPTDPAQILSRFGGDYSKMNDAIDFQRNGVPAKDPMMRALTSEQLAQADRYSAGGKTAQSMQSIGGWPLKVLGLPVVAGIGTGYEAAKGAAPVLNTLADVLDTMKVPDSSIFNGNQFRVGANSSKPSLDNIGALLKGYLSY